MLGVWDESHNQKGFPESEEWNATRPKEEGVSLRCDLRDKQPLGFD